MTAHHATPAPSPPADVSLDGILADTRILEISTGLAGETCGHALAGFGAQVIRIAPREAASGEPWHPLDEGKTVAALDLGDRGSLDELTRIARSCALVIEERPASGWSEGVPLAPELVARLPHLAAVCLSPFGLTGPLANHPAYPLNCAHAGGYTQQMPCDALHPEFRDRAPLQAGGDWSEAQAGALAAVAALALLLDRERSGGTILDCSKQEALLSLNWPDVVRFPNEGRSPTRLAPLATIVGGILPAADGFVQVAVREDHQWAALAGLLGHPGWARDPRFATRAARGARWQEIAALLAAETRRHPLATLHREGRERGVPMAGVFDLAALLQDEDLLRRGAWRSCTSPDGTSLRMPRWQAQVTYVPPAPTPDSSAAASRRRHASPFSAGAGPLAGLRVLDLGWVAMGPYAGYLLAALGAEVVHIARPATLQAGGVDPARYNYGFDTLNTGKTWIGLDLAQQEGRDLFHALVAEADIVLENFRPGVADRLGIGFAALHRINPQLVMVSASTYGHNAMGGAYVGYAPVFAALSGLADLTGYPDGPPTEVSTPVDFCAGSIAVLGLIAGLHRRQLVGTGCHIDLAAREAILWTLTQAAANHQCHPGAPQRRGNGHPTMSPHGVYRCRGENRWISLAIGSDAEWQRLVVCIDDASLATDPRYRTLEARLVHRSSLDAHIEAWTRERDLASVFAALRTAGIAAFPSMTSEDLWTDPHLQERGIFQSREAAGGRRWYLAGPWTPHLQPPGALATCDGDAALEAVFAQRLGLPAARIAALLASGVIAKRTV